MEGTSQAQGSPPSEQLVAFNPMGLEAVVHRGNGDSFSGLGTVRSAGDPFAGWLDGVGSVPNVSASQVAVSTSTSGYATQSYIPNQLFRTWADPAQIATSGSHTSLGCSSASAQLSSTSAVPGGMRYSPSHVQTSGTQEQWQYSPYSPSHDRTHLRASQYSISPIQTTISNARYSPSHEELSYEYSPTPVFGSRLLATTDDAPQTDAYPATSNGYARAIAQVPIDALSITKEAASDSGHNSELPSISHRAIDHNGKCRSFIVHGVPHDTPHCSISLMLPIHEYPSLANAYLKHIEHRGMFSVTFADIREAIEAMNKIRQSRPGWQVTPATAHEISTFTGATKHFSIPRDDEFVVTAYADPVEWTNIVEHLSVVVESVITSFGSTRSLEAIEEGMCWRKYHVEYYNIHHATYAFSCLDGYKVESLQFKVNDDRQEDIYLYPRLHIPNYGSPQSPVTPHRLSSVSKKNCSGEYDNERKVEISPTSEGSQTSPEHAISLERIRQGLDVRSTVMIRNIPNKITSDQLKDILDESSYGKYDFLYLRMDFTHGCNVGYAFMNFGDAIDIVNLVHARQGKTWPDCISEKKAEISYATLQGKEALVNKFRNSNVMTRPAEERPRLFYISGPRAGTEAIFPGPNDASKLRRSVASTTQQGLFAPRNRTATTPRTNRTRAQSQSFSQTPRSRAPGRTPRHSGGRSLQHAPGELSLMRADDHRVFQNRN
ncbi:RNA recognition motif 2 [Penicillium paradoxum]|uniref:RNA recognition motif 2 n=1 Tax=Penicillium paradoxum TaxID=176176 RepID=UPI002548B33B|nr:RNA recognition motif 2 [Penicillium paradoxum]KAJ5779031.1 RNA recognition motif 2 [Penicillium paradoxum]